MAEVSSSHAAIAAPLRGVALSDDEQMVVVLSVVLALATWILWYRRLAGVRMRGPGAGARKLVGLAPPTALLVIYAILQLGSAQDVRDSPPYLFQYTALGAAWLGVAMVTLGALGLSARADVAERGNSAAAVALFGALSGLALCFGGGNVGDGPGWWVVLFCAGLATAAWIALWAIVARGSAILDSVGVDRDLAAGIRLAAYCLASGLILCRAVAGDWQSAGATLRDLASRGWPAVPLAALVAALERPLGPTPRSPRGSTLLQGVLPGAAYVLAALVWVFSLGDWA